MQKQIKMRLDNLIYTVDKDDVLEIERLSNLGAVEYDKDIKDKVEDAEQDIKDKVEDAEQDIKDKVEDAEQDNETEDEPKKESKKSSKK